MPSWIDEYTIIFTGLAAAVALALWVGVEFWRLDARDRQRSPQEEIGDSQDDEQEIEPDQRRRQLAWRIVVACVAVALGAFLVWYGTRHVRPLSPEEVMRAASLEEGHPCYADAGAPDRIVGGAVSLPIAARWMQLSKAKDIFGLRELARLKFVAELSHGETLHLIDMGEFCEVRVMTGQHAGAAVWVYHGYLRRYPPR